MAIDLKKRYRTRDGRPVRLISDKGPHKWPIVGYIGDASHPTTWTLDGYLANASVPWNEDLVEDKTQFTFEKWLIIATEQSGIIDRGDILFVASDERRAKEEIYRHRSTGHVKCAIQRATLNITEGEVTE